MKIAGVICALVLASFATLSAQTPTLSARRINVLVVENTPFESMVKMLSDLSGVAIEFDATVPMELRVAPVGRLQFRDTELVPTLEFLTKRANLAFSVTGPNSIRIVLKTALPKV